MGCQKGPDRALYLEGKMKKKGFTLVELLISLTLASLLLFFSTQLIFNFIKTSKLLSKEIDELQIKQLVLNQIAKDVRSSDSITIKDPHRLGVKHGSSTITYDINDDKIRRKKDSASSYLTEAGEAKTLSFDYPQEGLVMIKLDSFETGVYVRNKK